MPKFIFIYSLILLLVSVSSFAIIDSKWGDSNLMTYNEVVEKTFIPVKSKRNKSDVHTNTLIGKVMCGYQGWFSPKRDGSNLDWMHYKLGNDFYDGSCCFDFWPDTSEYEDLYNSPFKYSDGSTAKLYSAADISTSMLHFKWMYEYDIDGVFIQRFGVGLAEDTPKNLWFTNIVLNNSRVAANKYGRVIALSYDLAAMDSSKKNTVNIIKNDWKRLVDKSKLTSDPAYLKHKGKPVIQIWCIGTNDDNSKRYSIEECAELINFFQNDPVYGGCFVIAGVPTGWRTLDFDAVNDPKLLELMEKVDAISPWTIGRFGDINDFNYHLETRFVKDLEWCNERGIIYFPTAFPGFSWNNMVKGAKINEIPRLEGDFLWAQYLGFKKIGVKCVYQSMFDEIDEGTAIYKCTNNPPVGKSQFATYEGLPSDYYLRLVGEGKKLINGKRLSKEKLMP